MSDQERPLSRRERRAQEQREAQRLDDTAALEPGLDTHGMPLFAPDGRPLSRRERRRLERLENPVETWTAEEEMIATGQIPAMTPERIAEQERVARDKAEAAQREARTASAELLSVAEDTDAESADAAPKRASLIPESPAEAPEPEIDAPVNSESASDYDDEGQEDPEASVAEPAQTAPSVEPVPAAGPAVDPDASPDVPASAEVVNEPEPASAPSGEVDAPEPAPEPEAPLGMPPGMTPEMFAMLFPPGSAQRRLMEEQATAASQDSAPQPQPTPSAEPAAEAWDTSEPAGGLDVAPSGDLAEEPVAAERPQSDSAPAAWSEDVADETPEPWGYEPAPEDQERPVDLWATSHVGTDDAVSAPSFEDLIDNDGAQEAPATTGGFAAFAPVSAPSAADDAATAGEAPGASPWDSHPLMTAEVPQVAGAVDIDVADDDLESEPLPRPDLSNVRTSTYAPVPDVEPVPTGNFAVEPREKPELHPAGGARHFGWAQLAVLGAVAFALGVIVWNVMKGS